MSNDTPHRANRPVLLAVDEDDAALARIERELERRYGVDYQVVCLSSSRAAIESLRALKATQVDVAVVLADHALSGMTGAELLIAVNELYPIAKRAVLINWGAWAEPATAAALHHAIALGHSDYYVLKPWRSPDEYFHRTIAEFVHEWSRLEPSGPKEVSIVGEQWSARSHEVVSLLARSGFPHTFFAASSPEGAAPARGAWVRLGEPAGGLRAQRDAARRSLERGGGRGGRREHAPRAAQPSTSSSSALGRQASRRGSMRPRRGSTRSSSSATRSGARRARAR